MVQTQQIESAREIVPQQYAGDATYETQIDTEKDRYGWCTCQSMELSTDMMRSVCPHSDARAVMERNIKANADGSAEQDSGKVYRGQAAYKNYVSKNEAQIGMNKYTGCVNSSVFSRHWESVCILTRFTERRVQFELRLGLVPSHALITSRISARITKRRASAATETAASSFMIVATTRAAGRLSRSGQLRRKRRNTR